MQPERPECPCLACAQLQHQQANDIGLLLAIGTVVAVGGLVWLVGRVAGLLASGVWPDVPLVELPGILVRLRDHAGDPAAAWPTGMRDQLPGPLGMYATLAGILLVPVALGRAGLVAAPATRPTEVASHPPPSQPPRAASGGAPGPAHAAAARARGGAVTATTLRTQRARLTGRARSGGDAQGRAATNPVAALPCARTPLPNPLSIPLLIPLLIPSSATVGVAVPARAPFRQVRGPDPGPAGRAQTPRATGRGLWGSRGLGGPLDRGRSLARFRREAPHQLRGGPPGGQPSSPSLLWVVGWLNAS
jgi:hypothetical protein